MGCCRPVSLLLTRPCAPPRVFFCLRYAKPALLVDVGVRCTDRTGCAPAQDHRPTPRENLAWSGCRPSVRGVAMNPVDHPHGGGEGKSKGGISRTPWGKPTKGYRTRHSPRTDWAIRLSRHKAKRSTRG